tara:strand:+ start:1471 stop:1677 length:207 start_codon:yes stop_codon:yes gene_type:complete
MPAKETIVADKICSQALVYFYAMSQVKIREASIEMLCSKDYDTPWNIKDYDNWSDFISFSIDDPESMN